MAYGRNRFAVANANTVEKYRMERNLILSRAKAGYKSGGMPASEVVALVKQACEWHDKVKWAMRKTGAWGV